MAGIKIEKGHNQFPDNKKNCVWKDGGIS